jgi:hypothetical protein
MGEITSLFPRKVMEAVVGSIDRAAMLASLGLDLEAPWDPKAMISDLDYYDMLEKIAAQTDVTALPVTVGASMRCDEYGALGLAWKAAPNLLASFSRIERFARLWTSVVSYELQNTSDGVLFVLHRDAPQRLGVRLSNETSLVASVSIARQVSPLPLAPLKAFFKHRAPKTTAPHEDYLQCPVVFDAPHYALLFAPEALEQPNILGDEGIT